MRQLVNRVIHVLADLKVAFSAPGVPIVVRLRRAARVSCWRAADVRCHRGLRSHGYRNARRAPLAIPRTSFCRNFARRVAPVQRPWLRPCMSTHFGPHAGPWTATADTDPVRDRFHPHLSAFAFEELEHVEIAIALCGLRAELTVTLTSGFTRIRSTSIAPIRSRACAETPRFTRPQVIDDLAQRAGGALSCRFDAIDFPSHSGLASARRNCGGRAATPRSLIASGRYDPSRPDALRTGRIWYRLLERHRNSTH